MAANASLVASLKTVIKSVTASRDAYVKDMKAKEGNEAIIAGRNANSAANDIASLERVLKRAEAGTY